MMATLIWLQGPSWAQSDPRKDQALAAATMRPPGNIGEHTHEVMSHGSPTQAGVALTLDLCDGSVDQQFIELLLSHKIKATLFVSGRWARQHKSLLKELAQQPLFEIENHGYQHRPLTSRPSRVYGIPGTSNLEEAYSEVVRNETLIKELTGKTTKYFRAGTATYDQRGLAMLAALGYRAVGYDILPGDASQPQNLKGMVRILLATRPGSVILMHLNHPNWRSRQAFSQALAILQQRGLKFVHLDQLIDPNI